MYNLYHFYKAILPHCKKQIYPIYFCVFYQYMIQDLQVMVNDDVL